MTAIFGCIIGSGMYGDFNDTVTTAGRAQSIHHALTCTLKLEHPNPSLFILAHIVAELAAWQHLLVIEPQDSTTNCQQGKMPANASLQGSALRLGNAGPNEEQSSCLNTASVLLTAERVHHVAV